MEELGTTFPSCVNFSRIRFLFVFMCVCFGRIQAGSSMSGSGVSKYGCVLSSSGTNGSTSVGWRDPMNFRHLSENKHTIKSLMDVRFYCNAF